MDKMPMQSKDLTAENFRKLAELFPQAVTETITGYDDDGKAIIERAIDPEILQQEITAHVLSGKEERYQFTWPDKRRAIVKSSSPATVERRDSAGNLIEVLATLRPCREESVNFDTTENLYIEGDNLDVLKMLRETYLGRVKMIYIDPPYNTGNDFVYNDDFAEDTDEFLARDGQIDDDGNRMVKNLDSNGRFHTDWLNMMYPRLRVARDLLAYDGVIFISIDDNEVENLKKICNEIFGEENFKSCISWQKRYTRSNNTVEFTTVVEYILVYSKASDFMVNLLMRTEDADNRYTNPDNDPRGPWKGASFLNPATPAQRPNLCYLIRNPNTGIETQPTTNAWRRSKEVYEQLLSENKLYWGLDGKQNVPSIKMFLSEARGLTPINFWSHEYAGNTDQGTQEFSGLLGGKYFNNPKPTMLLKRVLEHGTADDSIILDFFSGSSTTAHAVMQLNAEDGGKRKFVMVQLPEVCDEKSEAAKAGYANICEIGKKRIRRAGQKIKDEAGLTALDLDIGFRVLKLDSTNMKDVYYTPGEIAGFIIGGKGETLIDNIKEDRTPEDLLFQVMLDLGVPLSAKIELKDILGADVYFIEYGDSFLIACFGRVTGEIVTQIAQSKPYFAVFRDGGFEDDNAFVNAEQIFQTYSPETERRVL